MDLEEGVPPDVSLSVFFIGTFCTLIIRSARDFRWRGSWLVFMNKRHNFDRMMYDQHASMPPPSFLVLLKIHTCDKIQS